MNETHFRSVSVWSGALMIVLLVFFATAIVFTDLFNDRLYGNKRIFFVILLFAYAIYRAVRIRQILRRRKNEG